jgi:hypothetical protein
MTPLKTRWKIGNTFDAKAGKEREREDGMSEERFQAEPGKSLRARGPRGLEFLCRPAPEKDDV